jgi:hypothetical protein
MFHGELHARTRRPIRLFYFIKLFQTQILLLLDFWTVSIIWYSEKNTFRKLDLFPSSGEKMGSVYSVESVGKAGGSVIQFPKRVISRILDDEQSPEI